MQLISFNYGLPNCLLLKTEVSAFINMAKYGEYFWVCLILKTLVQ